MGPVGRVITNGKKFAYKERMAVNLVEGSVSVRLDLGGPVGKHVGNHAFVATVSGIVFGGVGGRAEAF